MREKGDRSCVLNKVVIRIETGRKARLVFVFGCEKVKLLKGEGKCTK